MRAHYAWHCERFVELFLSEAFAKYSYFHRAILNGHRAEIVFRKRLIRQGVAQQAEVGYSSLMHRESMECCRNKAIPSRKLDKGIRPGAAAIPLFAPESYKMMKRLVSSDWSVVACKRRLAVLGRSSSVYASCGARNVGTGEARLH